MQGAIIEARVAALEEAAGQKGDRRKALSRRLAKLEVRSSPDRDAQGRTLADVLRERQCRRLAQERNIPYENVLQERLAEI